MLCLERHKLSFDHRVRVEVDLSVMVRSRGLRHHKHGRLQMAEAASSTVTSFHKLVEVYEEQETFLRDLLAEHSGCEYLQRHGLAGKTDPTFFKQHVPVIQYEAIEQDVQRILQGDDAPILTCHKVVECFASSGTTSGKRRLFPVTESWHKDALRMVHIQNSFATVAFGETRPTLNFMSVGKTTKSPGGLTTGPGTTSFINRHIHKQSGAPSPAAVTLCQDYKQAVYCHLLCGLLQASDIKSLASHFASGLAIAFSILRQSWQDICNDIETGKLSSKITDVAAREAVSQLLERPNPDLANFIRAECGKKSWEGILLRLWPNVKVLICVATGAMLQYAENLSFLSGGQIPIFTNGYGGSEGGYAINHCPTAAPHETTFLMLPHIAYFEFLVLEENYDTEPYQGLGNENPLQVVDLASVREGQQYELVVSTHSGLWRYRVGDVLKCVGFYHNAPIFRFMGRLNVILSINTEKTEEYELIQVVTAAAKQHLPATTHLLDFTSCTSVSSVPGHYVIFLELTSEAVDTYVGAECLEAMCLGMEASLSEPYRRGRNIGAIAPLELRILGPGTFDRLKARAEESGTTPWQHKNLKAVKAGNPALDVLDTAVTERAISPRQPPHHTLNPLESG